MSSALAVSRKYDQRRSVASAFEHHEPVATARIRAAPCSTSTAIPSSCLRRSQGAVAMNTRAVGGKLRMLPPRAPRSHAATARHRTRGPSVPALPPNTCGPLLRSVIGSAMCTSLLATWTEACGTTRRRLSGGCTETTFNDTATSASAAGRAICGTCAMSAATSNRILRLERIAGLCAAVFLTGSYVRVVRPTLDRRLRIPRESSGRARAERRDAEGLLRRARCRGAQRQGANHHRPRRWPALRQDPPTWPS